LNGRGGAESRTAAPSAENTKRFAPNSVAYTAVDGHSIAAAYRSRLAVRPQWTERSGRAATVAARLRPAAAKVSSASRTCGHCRTIVGVGERSGSGTLLRLCLGRTRQIERDMTRSDGLHRTERQMSDQHCRQLVGLQQCSAVQCSAVTQRQAFRPISQGNR
jgi:hypothetical protein